ncbi:MAG: hypothetical protein LQ351_008038 [Letrouitia transgressa]|nr:MAG: hypothetical protein LQ351_008038 [Letrouitia transgressa]
MAVLGSGPAGFYTAYKVLSRIENAHVDMYDSLPVPFGLVRFGVAPDHPEIKKCQDKFTEVASSSNFTFVGNIEIGKDLPLELLATNYDALLFAYGAATDRKLGIPNEDGLKGIYSARAFVGWYNGLPEYANLAPELDSSEDVVIIGQGNVALDVARTLLTDVDTLKKTDMTDQALAALARSKVQRVRVVGRRGPMQASFTIKEVRELTRLPSVAFLPVDRNLLPENISKLPRTAKRLTQLLIDGSSVPSSGAQKWCDLQFFLSPQAFMPSQGNASRVGSVEFVNTKILESNPFEASARVIPTENRASISTSLAFRSIGYKSEALPGMNEIGVHFDKQKQIISNDYFGRIVSPTRNSIDSQVVHGMYCAGWVKRGPTGVIANTMEDSFATADALVDDWKGGVPFLGGGDGWDAIKNDTVAKGTRPVSWEDWLRIDKAERARGELKGKEREKFTTVEQMLQVLQ